MNLLEQFKQEKKELIDPFILFQELANITKESTSLIASVFVRYNNISSIVNLNLYMYSETRGIIKITQESICENFIFRLTQGYERVIITKDIDDWSIGDWALSYDGVVEGDINGVISYRPFFYKRDEVKDFLVVHKLPLPPCVTLIESLNSINASANKKEVSTAETHETNTANSQLIEQLAKAKEEIEELKKKLFECENVQIKKGSTKTINAQAKFIKALLYVHYGVDVANNPRPHIENIDGEIKLDFDRSGLGRELPSYLTVKQWVDRVELDTGS